MAKTLHHEFALDRSLSGRKGAAVAVARALATASRVDASGNIEIGLAANTGRFDHNPVTSTSLGLLIEETRTNIIDGTVEMQNGWAEAFGSMASLSATGPGGPLTANVFTVDDGGGADGWAYSSSGGTTGVISTAYALSIFAKQQDVYSFFNRTQSWSTPGNVGCHWDLTDGSAISAGSGHTQDAGVDYGDDWYRFNSSFTLGGSDSVGELRFGPSDNADFLTPRNGTNGVLMYGPQMEVGAFPTSYISNELIASSKTRNADVATASISAEVGAANTTYVKFRTGYIGQDTTVVSFHDGTANERVALEITGGDFHFIGVDGGVTQFDISTAATADTEYEAVLVWTANDAEFYLDGTSIGTDASASLPSVDTLNIGSDHADAEQLNSTFAALRNYDERLDGDTIDAIFTGEFPPEGVAAIGVGFTMGKMGMR